MYKYWHVYCLYLLFIAFFLSSFPSVYFYIHHITLYFPSRHSASLAFFSLPPILPLFFAPQAFLGLCRFFLLCWLKEGIEVCRLRII